MKKFFVFLTIYLSASVHVSAYDAKVNNICYNLSGTEATVTYGEGIFQQTPEYTGNVVIPATINYAGTDYLVTGIGNFAFSGCGELASISIPVGVTNIGSQAFAYCNNLTEMEIPNGVTSIGASAFAYCYELAAVTIPSSVTAIGSDAFTYCFALSSITNLNPMPVNIAFLYVFDNVFTSVCNLIVPASAVSRYQTANVWKEFNVVSGGFLVNPTVNNSEYGYATGNQLYNVNAAATVTATAYTGYKFVNWTIDNVEVSTDNPFSFNVTEDVELTANFEISSITSCKTIKALTVNVYPNPTTGIVYVENESNIKIYNAQGILLQSIIGNQVDLSGYPNGVYLLLADEMWERIIKN